jgi:hypothetical protein
LNVAYIPICEKTDKKKTTSFPGTHEQKLTQVLTNKYALAKMPIVNYFLLRTQHYSEE